MIQNQHHWKVTVVMTEMPESVAPLVSVTEAPVTEKSLAVGSVVPDAIVNVNVANSPVGIPTTTGGIVLLVFAVNANTALPGLVTLAINVGRTLIVLATPDNA